MKLVLALLFGVAMSGPAVQIISQGSTTSRVVALTFDAGADRGYAGRILTSLEHYRIRATFGMTGLWAKANGDLLRRMRRDGDQIINHTYDHRSFTGFSTGMPPLSTAQRSWEILQADRLIVAATGRSSKPYFRPPYGDYDAASLSLLRQLGYRYMIMWTVDSLGWDHLPASIILQRCLQRAQPGAIYLMHVGSQSQDAIALDPFIAGMKKRGYSFQTVAQLVGRR